MKITEIRLHSSCRFLKFWSICFSLIWSFSWKQKIFVVVFFKVSLKAKISLVEGKFFQDEVMIWGLICLILSLRQVVTCKVNKANTYKSRARPTDLEWLKIPESDMEWLKMTKKDLKWQNDLMTENDLEWLKIT